MFTDSTGKFPILITLVIGIYVAWVVHDINQINSGDVYFDSVTGEIINSYKVQNPFVILGYSIQLKYFSEDKEYFSGSASSIYGEWMWHNILFDGFATADSLGIHNIFGYKTSDLLDNAKFVGLGHNIFEEIDRPLVLIPSLIIEGSISRRAIIFDLIQYIRNGGE